MSQSIAAAALVSMLAIPFVWSVAVSLARATSVRPDEPLLREGTERGLLVAMVAPAALGAAFLIARFLAPAGLKLPAFPDIGGGAAPGLASIGAAASSPQGAGGFGGVAAIVLAAYGCGALAAALRLWLGERRARRIAAQARELPGAFGGGVYVTQARVTPFASACGRIVAPRLLFDTLSDDQAAMVIRHERAHLDRGDPRLYRMLAWCDVVFWWNPFVRRQAERCRLCAELACDRAASGDAPGAGQTLARAILAVLRALSEEAGSRTLPKSVAAGAHGHALRIRILTRRAAPPSSTLGRAARLSLIGLLAPFAAAQAAGADSAGPGVFSVVPAEGRISSPYGDHRDTGAGEARFHSGVDIAARAGTPVLAPAAGLVTRVQRNVAGYGNLVEIDHGGGAQTRFAQLGEITVAVGDQVGAGAPVGTIGASPQAGAAPHVHLELFVDGQTVDPAGPIPMPPANAAD